MNGSRSQELRLIVTDCEFHNQDEMIRDIIVLNSVNKKVQERLLETDDLDLSKALKIAKIHETNIEQMKLISNTDVHYVGSRSERKPATRQRYAAPPVRRTDGARPKTWRSPDDAECSNCSRIHTRQTCPAQDKTCHNCTKPNHFAAMCRSTAPTQSVAVRQRKRPQRVHAINDADYDTSDPVAYPELVSRGVSERRKCKWLVRVGASITVSPPDLKKS